MPATAYTTTAIAFFDLDGTVTRKDTLAEFLKFYKGKLKYYFGLMILSPVIIAYKIGFMSNHRAKEILLAYFLKGVSVDSFNEACSEFGDKVLSTLFRQQALYEIRRHLQNNTEVVIVSASPENWIKPWSDRYNITCIATKLQAEDGHLTGKIEGRNCHGQEKVSRIHKSFNLSHYSKIFAYGDTRGDLPMLSLATDSYYKPFKERAY
jgi:phosphatidylglycerophosphatase C